MPRSRPDDPRANASHSSGLVGGGRAGTRFANSSRMPDPIRFTDIEETTDLAPSGDSAAPRLLHRRVSIRCRLSSSDAEALEAIRYARRAMLREEWTRGAEEDEPSLEDAVFSAYDVVWSVPEYLRERCVAKLDELLRRANRARLELSAAARA
jgi:hypothetical protein